MSKVTLLSVLFAGNTRVFCESLRHLDAFEDMVCTGFAKRPRTFILATEGKRDARIRGEWSLNVYIS